MFVHLPLATASSERAPRRQPCKQCHSASIKFYIWRGGAA
jgi:hypothetical protein